VQRCWEMLGGLDSSLAARFRKQFGQPELTAMRMLTSYSQKLVTA
jgi:hypothetical protein